MKIAIAQVNYTIGDFHSNTKKIISNIREAKKEKSELVVFAELAVCGYPPQDFLDFDDFILLCNKAIDQIASECIGIAAIVGAPSFNRQEKGKRLFNSAYFLENGKIKSIHHKSLLPNYGVFDEYRYFEPSQKSEVVEFKGKKLAITICEDLWSMENGRKYENDPMAQLSQQNPDLLINIAASPFSYQQEKERTKMLQANATKYNISIIYVNHIGAQTELIFDGGSRVVSADSSVVSSCGFFQEELSFYNIDEKIRPIELPSMTKMEKIHHALILGIRDYFRKLNFTKATLGLSGGLDSSLVLALAVEALGKENVFPILMPSQFSSTHSINDSEKLCQNLGCEYETIPIKDVFNSFNSSLEHLFQGKPFDVTEENIQARIRGTLLMAYANKFNAILLNTSNKSEMAVGYGTLYGDMAGGISVIGDVYKTEAFDLCRYINRNEEIIPYNIINKPPSAELRPEQLDTDSLPPYSILDQILFHYIEESMSPSKIISMGFEKEVVDKNINRVNMNEYKRQQAAPVLRVSPKAFGTGRRMPIVGKFLSSS